MKNLIAVAFATLFLLAACSDNPTDPTPSNDIWPMKVGNYWVYQIKFFNQDSSLTSMVTDTIRVLSDTVLRTGIQAKILQSSRNRDNGLPNSVLIKNDNGVNNVWAYSNELIIWYKYPVQDGETYKYIHDSVTVQKMNLPKKILNLRNESILYSFYRNDDQDKSIIKNYFSLGVGRVFTVSYSYYNGKYFTSVVSELIAYHLE